MERGWRSGSGCSCLIGLYEVVDRVFLNKGICLCFGIEEVVFLNNK